MKQMKWEEQLLFSAGELLELEAVWCSGVFPARAQAERQQGCSTLC